MAASGTGNVPHMEAWSSSIKSCLAAWTRKFHTSGEDRRASQAVHCVGGTEREREREWGGARETQRAASQSAGGGGGGGECRLLLHPQTPPPTRGTAARLWSGAVSNASVAEYEVGGCDANDVNVCTHMSVSWMAAWGPPRYFPSLSENRPVSPQHPSFLCKKGPDCGKKKKNFFSFFSLTTCAFPQGLPTGLSEGHSTLWSQAELVIRVLDLQTFVKNKKMWTSCCVRAQRVFP